MVEVIGLQKVLDALRAKAVAYGGGSARAPRVVTGYSAPYALIVHEDRERHHVSGRAGFLLDVAREMRRELASSVRASLKSGLSVGQALLRAGLLLQRESQKNCPVRTGNLRDSAFTRLE